VIARCYATYVDRLAADRGVVAFVKWFCLGLMLQVAFMLPALPLLVVGVAIGGESAMTFAAILFVVAFLATRVFLFALPCKAVAERKGLSFPLGWAAGGLVFGPIATGVIAALSP
jgi:hypothetical protein